MTITEVTGLCPVDPLFGPIDGTAALSDGGSYRVRGDFMGGFRVQLMTARGGRWIPASVELTRLIRKHLALSFLEDA